MSTAHKNLTGSDLHEPKGAASATSGQVYVADGAGSGTWTTPTTPGIVMIKTQTASTSSTIDFVNGVSGVVLDDTYDMYEFQLIGVRPSADDADLYLQIGTGGGPTYQTTNYTYNNLASYAASSTSTNSAAAAAVILNCTTATIGLSNTAAELANFVIKFSNPEVANYTSFMSTGNYIAAASSYPVYSITSGYYNAAGSIITGIRFKPDSGTILEGRFTLFGYKKS